MQNRWLLLHDGCGEYVEFFDEAEVHEVMDRDILDEVTGIERHEKEFIKQLEAECLKGGVHLDPVHFNRGKHGHVWLCVKCRRQLTGPKLPSDEKAALLAFTRSYREEFKTRKGLNAVEAKENDRMEQMTINLVFKPGTTAKSMAEALRMQANLLEGITGKAASNTAPKKSTAPVDDEDEDTSADADEDEEDFAPKKKVVAKKKAAAAFDDEDEEDAEVEALADDEDEEELAPKKKVATKKKKLTVDDINDAAKACAKANGGGEEGRGEVLARMKKNFKVKSVNDVKPEDYEKFIKVMQAE